MDVISLRRNNTVGRLAGTSNSPLELRLSRPRPACAVSRTNEAGPFVVARNLFSGGLIMMRALRSLVIAGLVGLLLLCVGRPAAKAADPTWGHVQTSRSSSDSYASNQVYFYNNSAPSTAAPSASVPTARATNSSSVAYRSYSSDPGSNSGYYYFSPGSCACYYYAPAPSPAPATAQALPNPTATNANANSGTYRSFSPDPAPTANYSYSYPGTYSYSSHSGHSWGGRR